MLKPEGKSFIACTWRDPHGTGKTSCLFEHELPHSCVTITTYGWLMRQDEKGVSLVGEIINDSSMRDYTFVPTELIETIETIRIPVRRKRDQIQKSENGGVADATARAPEKDSGSI